MTTWNGESTVGQLERTTQDRVVRLFCDQLGYHCLGNWSRRPSNRCVEEQRLREWLARRGVADSLANRAVHALLKAVQDVSRSLCERNRAVYDLLRYGAKASLGAGERKETVWLVDWERPLENDFAVAEEVTVTATAGGSRRPDMVLYVNGIALAVLELKRSTVSVSEGIRQNLESQRKEFVQPFFATVQWTMAGNDSEGLRHAAIETPEKHWLGWTEEGGAHAAEPNLLDRHLLQLCGKERFLELIHDFTAFDGGIRKQARHNQYFGVKAAQAFVRRRQGGIVWHTQGSGKSLTMVWLARWIREHRPDARVLVVTDRIELDEQIERVFAGVGERIRRTRSGAELIEILGRSEEPLVCSLVHKFGGREQREGADEDGTSEFVGALRRLPPNFRAKGDLHVFVDECHRTQSGELHRAMKAMLPAAVFVGFTGTPLLKADKARSVEVFGPYIHAYKFDQAVQEGVVLDLRYEVRDIDQRLAGKDKVDEWFEAKTKGLNDMARERLKRKWGTMQRVLSSRDRLGKIAADILLDMNTRPRLMDGSGNAILVAGSIYEACRFQQLLSEPDSELKGKCAMVTSYSPSADRAGGETFGEGEAAFKHQVHARMLSEWFGLPEAEAIGRTEQFEQEARKRFVEEPGRLKLLIVVDKLLTGFDAPSATCLYIDRQMRDHGLFQAVCRVNRLDGPGKEHGCIIDYKDLFRSLEGAVQDYAGGAFDAYERTDVTGLLRNRLQAAREDLDEALEAVRTLCEPVEAPRNETDYFHFFCAKDSGNAEQLKANEPKRLKLYKLVAALLRAYAAIAGEMAEAGFRPRDAARIKDEVAFHAKACQAVRLCSGDGADLKAYDPAMRHLIDVYIEAEQSRRISAFDDKGLIELLVELGPTAAEHLPAEVRASREATAETIENNVRRLIVKEAPADPAGCATMSELLDALIEQRRKGVLAGREHLERLAELARQAADPARRDGSRTQAAATPALRALCGHLAGNAELARQVDAAIRGSIMDGWRSNQNKTRKVLKAILRQVGNDQSLADSLLNIAKQEKNGY